MIEKRKMKRQGTGVIVILLLLGLALFAASHLYALDRDLPPWGVINYQPIDEGAYAMPALNAYTYGSIDPDLSADGIRYEVSPHLKTDVVGNLLTYAGLELLGDNYYGFRLGSVVCSFFNLLLIGLILWELKRKYAGEENSRGAAWLAAGILGYLLVDFCFLMSGRVIETTIYRLLFMLLVIYTFLKVKNSFLKAMLVGLLSLFSIFCIYATNAFLLLACAATLVGIWIISGFREFLRYLGGALVGMGIGYLLCEAYFQIFWGTHALSNMLDAVTSFAGQQGYTVNEKNLHDMVGIAVRFISSNINLYNTAFLFVCMAAVPCIIRQLGKKDVNLLFLVSLVGAFFLQTMVSEDYVVRKYLIVYPVLLMICYLLVVSGALQSFLRRKADGRTAGKVIYLLYLLGCAAVCCMVPVYRLKLINNLTYRDFSQTDRYVILVCSVVGVTVMAFWFLWQMRKRTMGRKAACAALAAVLAALLTVNLYMDCQYIFANKTYREKEIMIQIGARAGDRYVIGAVFPIGFTLYNDIKPVISNNDDIPAAMEQNPDMLYLDYAYNDVKDYIDSIFSDSKVELKNFLLLDRNFSTFGKTRSIELLQNVCQK